MDADHSEWTKHRKLDLHSTDIDSSTIAYRILSIFKLITEARGQCNLHTKIEKQARKKETGRKA